MGHPHRALRRRSVLGVGMALALVATAVTPASAAVPAADEGPGVHAPSVVATWSSAQAHTTGYLGYPAPGCSEADRVTEEELLPVLRAAACEVEHESFGGVPHAVTSSVQAALPEAVEVDVEITGSAPRVIQGTSARANIEGFVLMRLRIEAPVDGVLRTTFSGGDALRPLNAPCAGADDPDLARVTMGVIDEVADAVPDVSRLRRVHCVGGGPELVPTPITDDVALVPITAGVPKRLEVSARLSHPSVEISGRIAEVQFEAGPVGPVCRNVAHVTNQGDGSLTVLDVADEGATAMIDVGGNPTRAALTSDGSTVYVANLGDGSVSVVDTATSSVVDTIDLGGSPRGVAVTPDGTTVYVTDESDDSVVVIDAPTATEVARVPVGRFPTSVAVSPVGDVAYVTDAFDDTVSVIDTATNTVSATVGAGTTPFDVGFAPDGATAYVVNQGSSTVSIVDTAAETVSASLAVGAGPSGVAVSPDGAVAYVANFASGSVSVIDAATSTVTGTVEVGQSPRGIAFTADSSTALVTNVGSGTVSVIDVAGIVEVGTVEVGANPTAVVISCAAEVPAEVTYVARFSEHRCGAVTGIAAGLGMTPEEMIRVGVGGLRGIADAGDAVPPSELPLNEGPCEISVSWPADEAASIAAAASAWGVDEGQLHHAGGWVIVVLVYRAILEERARS